MKIGDLVEFFERNDVSRERPLIGVIIDNYSDSPYNVSRWGRVWKVRGEDGKDSFHWETTLRRVE